jgi:hypothetical protein
MCRKQDLTSDPPLKETVLGVFDVAEIVAGGSQNKQIDWFCAKFFAKSIAKNRNRLAFVVWEKFKKMRGVSRNLDFFSFCVQQFSRQLLHLEIF